MRWRRRSSSLIINVAIPLIALALPADLVADRNNRPERRFNSKEMGMKIITALKANWFHLISMNGHHFTLALQMK